MYGLGYIVLYMKYKITCELVVMSDLSLYSQYFMYS